MGLPIPTSSARSSGRFRASENGLLNPWPCEHCETLMRFPATILGFAMPQVVAPRLHWNPALKRGDRGELMQLCCFGKARPGPSTRSKCTFVRARTPRCRSTPHAGRAASRAPDRGGNATALAVIISGPCRSRFTGPGTRPLPWQATSTLLVSHLLMILPATRPPPR